MKIEEPKLKKIPSSTLSCEKCFYHKTGVCKHPKRFEPNPLDCIERQHNKHFYFIYVEDI